MPPPATERLTRAAVYALSALLLAITWGVAAAGKLLSGGVPDWFTEQFGKTFLSSFPGLTASFYSIALLEALAGFAALASLLGGEFLRARAPAFLYAALLLSLLLFVQLNFGKQLLADFDGTHDLFMYFAGALVIFAAVRSLDPSRSTPEPSTPR
jgi:hypothetical protein